MVLEKSYYVKLNPLKSPSSNPSKRISVPVTVVLSFERSGVSGTVL